MASSDTANQPTLARIALGDMVRRAREAKRLQPAELGAMIGYNRNSIVRIESGEQGTKALVIEKICQVLDIPAEQMSLMTSLVVRGKERGWWESFKNGAPSKFSLFAETEQTASLIQNWSTETIPGLVQTPEYLAELQSVALPLPHNQLPDIRGFRLKRQELLAKRRDKFRIQLLIGISALHHLDQMAAGIRSDQYGRLAEVDKHGRYEIRVAHRAHAAVDGGFTILTPGRGPAGQVRNSFVYIEFLDGYRYIEKTDVVSRYEQAFESAFASAAPLKEYLP
ncbi:helix-turn-helix protein [Stackebrandtia albiflava]|uniref:Helix-turn-helix protein n=1 Tax=Stackebrandtia albiflava TaxID=406432 RepID=A0A562URL9_9ACTN|nr:Scr1 family TA system antitoxin-like transcriptional regulator [Stackebrandtia albiflava]TWJ08251.1 helix-turn-helix protein [Stackebrandtia albiflava]